MKIGRTLFYYRYRRWLKKARRKWKRKEPLNIEVACAMGDFKKERIKATGWGGAIVAYLPHIRKIL